MHAILNDMGADAPRLDADAEGGARSAELIAAITSHATFLFGSCATMVRSKLNVRKRGTDLAELKALVRAHGVLQNLIGFKQLCGGVESGLIEIVAGGRRLQVVAELIAEGDLPEDYQIPWLMVTPEEAVAISLAENQGRQDMHPADVFDAMLALADMGRSVDDIALSFGVAPLAVLRRLKLAKVAPRLLDLYRNDQADFDQMAALAVSDDHAAQEQVWDSLSGGRRWPHDLRRLLTAQRVNVQTDRVARYVGLQAFERAGGTVERDLFSDSGAGYTRDTVLLERLAIDKMDKRRAKLLKQGAHWVHTMPRADRALLAQYGRVRQSPAPLSAQQRSWAAAIEDRMAELARRIAAEAAGPARAGLQAECDELDAQRRAIDASRDMVPDPGDKAMAGAVLALDEDGSLLVLTDLIRPDDTPKMARAKAAPAAGAAQRPKALHSERLLLELSSQRTAALQAELMEQGELALRYLTYTLMCKLAPQGQGETLAKLGLSRPSLAEGARKCAAAEALALRRQQLLARLPAEGKADDWWPWFAAQPQHAVLEMLAYCVAASLDATQSRDDPHRGYAALALSLQLDMGKWWHPTARGYFDHLTKEAVVAVVGRAVSRAAAAPLEKLGKAAMAQAAERALADSGWLPDILLR